MLIIESINMNNMKNMTEAKILLMTIKEICSHEKLHAEEVIYFYVSFL